MVPPHGRVCDLFRAHDEHEPPAREREACDSLGRGPRRQQRVRGPEPHEKVREAAEHGKGHQEKAPEGVNLHLGHKRLANGRAARSEGGDRPRRGTSGDARSWRRP